MIEFANLWVFILIPFYLLCLRFCPEKRVAIYFPHFQFVKKVNSDSILKFLILFFITLSLSNPYKKKEIIQTNKGDGIVLSIDSSGSMNQFNKFKIVQNVASNFISKRVNDKLGLVVFGQNAFIASPLTKDRKFVKDVLSKMYVGIAGQNTAILDSLIQSIRLLKKSDAKTRIIILLTDGIDNASKIEVAGVIKELKKYNIKVYTIGIGGSLDVNYQLLNYLSKQSGGKMYQALSAKDIATIYDTIDKLEKTDIKNKIIYKENYFIYPLMIAILLMIFYIDRRKKW